MPNLKPVPKVFQTTGKAKNDADNAIIIAIGITNHSGIIFLDSKNSSEPRLPPGPAGDTIGRNS